jgi:hypothetical protein
MDPQKRNISSAMEALSAGQRGSGGYSSRKDIQSAAAKLNRDAAAAQKAHVESKRRTGQSSLAAREGARTQSRQDEALGR